MKEDEFLDYVRGIEIALYSHEFSITIKGKNEEDKKKIRSLRTEISTLRSQLETNQLKVISGKLEELSDSLKKGISTLQDELEDAKKFHKAMETLGNVIGLISRIVTFFA